MALDFARMQVLGIDRHSNTITVELELGKDYVVLTKPPPTSNFVLYSSPSYAISQLFSGRGQQFIYGLGRILKIEDITEQYQPRGD